MFGTVFLDISFLSIIMILLREEILSGQMKEYIIFSSRDTLHSGMIAFLRVFEAAFSSSWASEEGSTSKQPECAGNLSSCERFVSFEKSSHCYEYSIQLSTFQPEFILLKCIYFLMNVYKRGDDRMFSFRCSGCCEE